MTRSKRALDPHQVLMAMRKLALSNLSRARDRAATQRKLRTEALFEREFEQMSLRTQAAVLARLNLAETAIAEVIYADLTAAINTYTESIGMRDHLKLVGGKNVPDQAAT